MIGMRRNTPIRSLIGETQVKGKINKGRTLKEGRIRNKKKTTTLLPKRKGIREYKVGTPNNLNTKTRKTWRRSWKTRIQKKSRKLLVR